jgi:hypothetical protein
MLIAGSTSQVHFGLYVSGVLTQADSITLAVKDGLGATVSLGDSPSYNALTGLYDVLVASDECTATHIGQTWDFIWTPVKDDAVLRSVTHEAVYESEPVSITATGSDKLLARLRDLISEEQGDFYDDPTEAYPSLNEGVSILFGGLDALPTAFSHAVAAVDGVYSPDIDAPVLLDRWIELGIAGQPLTPITTEDYLHLDLTATGTPVKYAMGFISATGAPILRLWPTPDAVVTISGGYYAVPPEITDAQGPTWHRGFHFIPCLYAASIMLEKDHRPESASRMFQRFNSERERYRHWLRTSHPYMPTVTEAVPLGTAFPRY